MFLVSVLLKIKLVLPRIVAGKSGKAASREETKKVAMRQQ